jgi:CHAD domain-containing protein
MKPEERGARAGLPIREYARGQASDLLRRVAFQANRTARVRDEEAVHDLRVSIRRLTQCLRVFKPFFPQAQAKSLRRKLGDVMDLASEVRNRDIALELLRAARVPAESEVARKLSQERKEAERTLVAALRRWSRRDSEKKWRARLGF